MSQFNRRWMVTLAGAAAVLAPLIRPKSAAADPLPVPERKTGATVLLDPPIRIYDSRNPFGSGTPKKIKSGERLSLGLGYSGSEEDPSGPALAGAFINLTVTQTVGAGFLTVQSYGLPTPVLTSNINWMSDGQTIANSSLVPVGGENVIDVICTGGETHYIIDLQGYVPYLPSLPPEP
jgi:hypothetical protein